MEEALLAFVGSDSLNLSTNKRCTKRDFYALILPASIISYSMTITIGTKSEHERKQSSMARRKIELK